MKEVWEELRKMKPDSEVLRENPFSI